MSQFERHFNVGYLTLQERPQIFDQKNWWQILLLWSNSQSKNKIIEKINFLLHKHRFIGHVNQIITHRYDKQRLSICLAWALVERVWTVFWWEYKMPETVLISQQLVYSVALM